MLPKTAFLHLDPGSSVSRDTIPILDFTCECLLLFTFKYRTLPLAVLKLVNLHKRTLRQLHLLVNDWGAINTAAAAASAIVLETDCSQDIPPWPVMAHARPGRARRTYIILRYLMLLTCTFKCL